MKWWMKPALIQSRTVRAGIEWISLGDHLKNIFNTLRRLVSFNQDRVFIYSRCQLNALIVLFRDNLFIFPGSKPFNFF